MIRVVVIGDSGHSKVVEDLVNANPEVSLLAKLDDRYDEVFERHGIIRGPLSYLKRIIDPDTKVVFGIGSNKVRQKLVEEFGIPLTSYITLVHPSATISPSASVGRGTVIMPGAVVNADAVIGDHVILNTGCVVEHDCKVGDYAHISPRACLTGGVVIGEGAQVGAGASVIPQKAIGNWTAVGAGATVITDIPERVTAVGVPARVIRKEGT
ncbi:acetyltransferase [Edaphobacillus lindanitolerans]|uniref:Acetyltransferase EpsM n=1 Tax=Edaphobacillus lindanitolerans TaxID=550447 RepID=A0A1U7PIF8_9BACI|nr:acetyltransferase [Edaphobacillus lindanitolerans]SIT73571.1 acetyltransferase EpsM [Edaphobacillus lindanitolerans]